VCHSLPVHFPLDRRILLTAEVGVAGPFSDKPILFFDRGARGSIPIKATKDFTWNSAIRSLRTVFVKHIE
jgi:hypothetical protein